LQRNASQITNTSHHKISNKKYITNPKRNASQLKYIPDQIQYHIHHRSNPMNHKFKKKIGSRGEGAAGLPATVLSASAPARPPTPGRRSRSRGRGGMAGEVERKGMKGRGRESEGDINERGGDREEIARGSRDSLCFQLV
jgi:hypothetical protein